MANGLTIGDEGVTHSTLRPVGKAQFNHKLFEVRTFGNYVSENQRVKIVELKDSQITVEII
jgi:membrane-bound ClpP family serine protease